MKKFTDTQNREWHIVLDVTTIKRVRDLLSVDLLKVVEGELLDQFATDPILLCDVLFAVCQPQAASQGVSDIEFGQGLAGDAIDAASVAFLEELISFFPQARRKVLGKVLEKIRMVERLTSESAMARLDDPELNRKIESLLASAGETSGDAPGSSASTPALSPTANST